MSDEKKTGTATMLGRWIFGGLVMLAGFWLGFWLGSHFAEWSGRYPALSKGAPVLSLAIMLSLAKTFFFKLSNFFDYLKGGKKVDLWQPAVALFFAALVMAIAFNGAQKAIESKLSAGTIVVWQGSRFAPETPAEDASAVATATGPYAVFPVFFAQEAGGYDPQTGDFAVGTSLEASESRNVSNLARSLLACGSQDQPVRLSVRGFASSSGVAGEDAAAAENFNLRAANARAESVAAVLRSATGGDSRVAVELVEWSGADEMRAAQSFNDAGEGGYNPAIGYLTKRVEIVLEDPGKCRVEDG